MGRKRENEVQSIFCTLWKINSTWIIELNIKPKAIKLVEENIGENLCDLGLDTHFLELKKHKQ